MKKNWVKKSKTIAAEIITKHYKKQKPKKSQSSANKG